MAHNSQAHHNPLRIDLVGFGLEFIILGKRKLKNQAYLVCLGTKGVSEGSQVSLIRAWLNMASRP